MKRTFILLFSLLVVLYAKQGYEFLTSDQSRESGVCRLTGYLSDIAEEVTAIPLQQSREYNIRYAKQVRKEGNNLFLVCNETLYRFNRQGELVSVITNPEMMRVSGYIIDHRTQELIVFGNEDDIHYYTFDGKLVERKKLRNNLTGERICSVAMHNNQIWTTEACQIHHPDTNQTSLEILAVKYDTNFNPLEREKIDSAELGREPSLATHYESEFSLNPQNGQIQLYTPPLSPEYLLSDSLYLVNHPTEQQSDSLTSYPTRMGSRFWIAACEKNCQPLQNYLFCYDTYTNQAWQLTEGFTDNYYHTGQVKSLRPMGIDNRHYYFCQSGASLAHSFPTEAQKDELVVFIVKMKA